MDALTVWQVWRRILRERRLSDAMFGEDLASVASALHLTVDEVQIVRAYASARRGTLFSIANYRFRMTRSFFHALETVAPLTRRALAVNSVSMDSLATTFLEHVEWRDFGPFVFTFGREVLDYLVEHPAVVAVPGISDLIRVERAAANVVISAAKSGDIVPPRRPNVWWANPWFEIVQCQVDLSPWLRDTKILGYTPPISRPRHYIAFLPALDQDRRIIAASGRAASMLTVLRSGMSEMSLESALSKIGHAPDRERDRGMLDQLSRLGLVVGPVDRG